VSLVRVLHPEFGYVGTSSFCRTFMALLVCGLLAGASGVAIFKAEPDPDPRDAMALAPAETLGNTAPVVESHSEKSEFAQRTPETGAIALATKSRRPRSVRAINERPAIAAVPIGHRDGPPVLALEPAIPVAATPETLEVFANPIHAAPAAEAPAIPAVTEVAPHAGSAKKSRTRSNHVQHRDRNEYSPSPNYGNHYYQPSYSNHYYQSGYARVL